MIGVLFDTLAIATATTVGVAITFALVARARRRRAERRARPSSREVSVRVTADTSAFRRGLRGMPPEPDFVALGVAGRRIAVAMMCGLDGHDFVDVSLRSLCSLAERRNVSCRRCGERPPTRVWEGDYA